jgi:hypothetical protein
MGRTLGKAGEAEAGQNKSHNDKQQDGFTQGKTDKDKNSLTEQQSRDTQKNGGAGRDRTDDILLAKQALSQLSYGPNFSRIC